jgi:hypothetical protein
MERSFFQEYLQAFNSVEGWFSFDAALLFTAYNQLIAAHGIRGDVLEIGVYHGLSAIAVAALRGPGNFFYAVDLFEKMQDQNVSQSGIGNRQIYERNLQRFHSDMSFIRTIDGPSTALNSAKLGTNFSFCHVDGGHSREETCRDLALCHSLLLPGGLIAVDDYFNARFPGVCEGVAQYMLQHPHSFRPLAIAYNKVLFQKLPAPFDVNEEFRRTFSDLPQDTVRMWDTPTLLITAVLRSFVDLHASTPNQLVRLGAIRRATLAAANSEVRANPNEVVSVPVRVTNTSADVFPSGEGVCGASYHLLSCSGEVLRHDNDRSWLLDPLEPGESKTVPLSVRAPAQRGDYRVEIDLVWEQVMWFKDVGNPTALVDLKVR